MIRPVLKNQEGFLEERRYPDLRHFLLLIRVICRVPHRYSPRISHSESEISGGVLWPGSMESGGHRERTPRSERLRDAKLVLLGVGWTW